MQFKSRRCAVMIRQALAEDIAYNGSAAQDRAADLVGGLLLAAEGYDKSRGKARNGYPQLAACKLSFDLCTAYMVSSSLYCQNPEAS